MPLEAGFGIDLTMLICPSSEWTAMYTYYNHGLEPPYGGVRSDETSLDLEMTVGWFDRTLGWTDDWVGYISMITGNHVKHDPDLPLEYRLRVLEQDEPPYNEGDVVLNITSESLDAEFAWIKASGLIVFKARDAFDLSWAGYLFYMKVLKDFSAKVKEQQ